jgi:dipeptidyl-peptidase 4
VRNTEELARRYERAARLTAPKVAAQTPRALIEGYWLDTTRYYFAAERFEPSLGRVVDVPSIVDCESQTVSEVLPFAILSGLLSQSAAALASATFDMPSIDTLAVSVGGMDFLVDTRNLSVVESRPAAGESALHSPDGRHACFVKGHDLWLRERHSGAERPLTTDGVLHHAYSRQAESCLSAITYRARPAPMGLWSPDSQWILTHCIDERSVPELALVQHAPPGGGRPRTHTFKYPMPGDPLPMATLVALHVPSGRVVHFTGFPAPVLAFSPFAFRMAWFSGRDTACFLRMDRYFRSVDLIQLDLARASGRIVLTETVSAGYLELHQFLLGTPNVRTLDSTGEVIWYSEREGWGHLYLYDGRTGHLKNQITRGEWLVRDIVHVDERSRRLLFTACGIDQRTDPARRSLCAVGLDGDGFEVLCAHDGDVFTPATEPAGLGQDRPFRRSYAQSGISADGRFGVVRFTSVERGNRIEMIDLRAREGFVVASVAPVANDVSPLPVTAVAADGTTLLHGVLFLPSDFDASQRYPLIDCVYPGPQMAWRPQSYAAVMSAQARSLAELGFVTLMLDTRGMPFRSRALHQAGYGELLEPQLADHVAVVRELCERYPFLDGTRVGMIGQSAGGAATARALCDHGDLFKVGVSACGNHDSTFNIALWSDKYRGPGDRGRWAAQANATAAAKLTGKLLLISGDMDENVHVSHTLVLAEALIRANRDFDLLIVPNAGHDVLMAHPYVQRRVWDYFVRHLAGEAPPEGFRLSFEPHELARLQACRVREFRQ